MKKLVGIIIGILCLAMSVGLVACTSNSGTKLDRNGNLDVNEMIASEGLELERVLCTYTVKGMGTCKDRNVVIPKYVDKMPVTSIDEEAFQGNEEIESIALPSTIVNVDEGAFNGCLNLKEFIVSSISPFFTAQDGCLIKRTGLSLVAGTTNAVIPSDGTVLKIAPKAFKNLRELTNITIPITITEIGEDAFYGDIKLVEVCNLSTLDIQVGSDENGFVGYYAKAIIYSEAESKITKTEDKNVLYDDGGEELLVSYQGTASSVTIPSGVAAIAPFALAYNTKVTSVVIPKSVTTIGRSAFEDCTALTTVQIGSGVKNIERCAFSGCIALTSVTLPSGLETIEENLFYNCKSLTSMVIPSSVITIKDCAFRNCEGVEAFKIPASVQAIGHYAFIGCTAMKSLEFVDQVGWKKIKAKYEYYVYWEARTNGEELVEDELADAARNASRFRNDQGNYDFYWYKEQ